MLWPPYGLSHPDSHGGKRSSAHHLWPLPTVKGVSVAPAHGSIFLFASICPCLCVLLQSPSAHGSGLAPAAHCGGLARHRAPPPHAPSVVLVGPHGYVFPFLQPKTPSSTRCVMSSASSARTACVSASSGSVMAWMTAGTTRMRPTAVGGALSHSPSPDPVVLLAPAVAIQRKWCLSCSGN